MSHPRFAMAFNAPVVSVDDLSQAAAALPEQGRIALFSPPADLDLSDLPVERLHVVTGFRPDFDALTARGLSVAVAPEGAYAAAIVVLPRAKAEARALIAEAAQRISAGGAIWIDGQKTDGVDAMIKELRARGAISEPIAKAHGKIFRVLASQSAFTQWQAAEVEVSPGFFTAPGVFSADSVDRGSALLAACLPKVLPARMADLGAGWGWLGAQVLAREGVECLDLIEADHTALALAQRNLTDPRARFFWADARRFEPEARYGAIVMNPPFHTGREADPALGQAFIRAAGQMLSLSGTLWMVANRHLPYDDTLRGAFHEVEEILPPAESGLGRDGAFRIIRAARPVIGAAAKAQQAKAQQAKAGASPQEARRAKGRFAVRAADAPTKGRRR